MRHQACQHVATGHKYVGHLSRCFPPALLRVILTALAGDHKFTMSTNHNLKYSRDAVKHPIKFKTNDHLNLEVNDLPHPSEPSQSIRLRDQGDIKAFEVRQCHMASVNSFVPCGTVHLCICSPATRLYL